MSKHKAQRVECPYCGRVAAYKSSAAIYGADYGMVYLCQPCDAYVGVHRGTSKPKGTLANRELREWRQKAHMAFDGLWIDGSPFSRSGAYKWLADKMGIPLSRCHIAMFDASQCQRAVSLCQDTSQLWAQRRWND